MTREALKCIQKKAYTFEQSKNTKHKKLKLNLERCNRGFCKLGSLFTQRNKEKYMLEHGSCLRLHLPFCIGAQ